MGLLLTYSCSQDLPLDQRTVIITGIGQGSLFFGEALPELMERAARETLNFGFTYFTLSQADTTTNYVPDFGRYGGMNMYSEARAIVHMMNTEEGKAA